MKLRITNIVNGKSFDMEVKGSIESVKEVLQGLDQEIFKVERIVEEVGLNATSHKTIEIDSYDVQNTIDNELENYEDFEDCEGEVENYIEAEIRIDFSTTLKGDEAVRAHLENDGDTITRIVEKEEKRNLDNGEQGETELYSNTVTLNIQPLPFDEEDIDFDQWGCQN